MFNSDTKTLALIVKLIKLTATGLLRWRIVKPPATLGDGGVPFFMDTVYKGQRLALYQQRYQFHTDGQGREGLMLAILDADGYVLWETFGPSVALDDLLATVRSKTSHVGRIIDELLSDCGEA